MKKVISILLCAVFAVTAAVPCFAQGTEEPSVTTYSYTEDLGDGFTLETTVEVSTSLARSSRGASKTAEIKHYGTIVGVAVLKATFNYDGSTSSAASSSGVYSTASGWSFSGSSTWCYDATAYLSTTLTGSSNYPISLSLTCTPSGAIR